MYTSRILKASTLMEIDDEGDDRSDLSKQVKETAVDASSTGNVDH